MNATIYKFPNKQVVEEQPLKLPLFYEHEMEVLLICINIFGDQVYDWNNINTVEPKIAIESLQLAKDSWYFSSGFVDIIDDMLGNVKGF